MSEPRCTWTETDSDFVYWAGLPSLPAEIRRAIRGADLVLLPDPGFGDYREPLFPSGTDELFQWLDKQAPPISVQIAIEDTEYRELMLHFAILRIAGILVKYALAPLAVRFLADWLRKRLGNDFASAQVRATVTVDCGDGERRRAVRISYEGPAKTFESSLEQALQSLDRGPDKPGADNSSRSETASDDNDTPAD